MTPEVRARLFEAIDLAYIRKDAITYAGISSATFYRWMADPRPEYREFREAFEQAELARDDARCRASLKVAALGRLFQLGKRSSRAMLKWLAVSSPEEWGTVAPHRYCGAHYRSRKPSPARVDADDLDTDSTLDDDF